MSKRHSQYKWLLIVEGNTDCSTYEGLLGKSKVTNDEFRVVVGGGKPRLCNASQWEHNIELWNIVQNDLGRIVFRGIILLVDSDVDSATVFDCYERNSKLQYVKPLQPKIKKEQFWHLDTLDGTNQIPILGISVPMESAGCLETVLLKSYGFLVEGQAEYTSLVEIVKKVSNEWKVPKLGNDKDWWEDNTKAKMDKFIYLALLRGFHAVQQKPAVPEEPVVIQHIKAAMNSYP